jgi:hypothetical protein
MNSLFPNNFGKRGLASLACVFRLLCFAVFLGLAACGPRQETAELTPKEMQAKLNQAMPKGTALARAREFMEKEKFDCEAIVDGEWKKKKVPRFLLCTRQDGKMIKRKWDVAVIHDGEKVLSVDMRTALVYP